LRVTVDIHKLIGCFDVLGELVSFVIIGPSLIECVGMDKCKKVNFCVVSGIQEVLSKMLASLMGRQHAL
jgi:hypothetical protein